VADQVQVGDWSKVVIAYEPVWAIGGAVQVDPIKPTLKEPGSKRSKLT
jgi:triosephosphate isomerase